jgi:hypothetical protein
MNVKDVENDPAYGTIPLSKSIIYTDVWAPPGFFGWMLKIQSGRTYPFRAYEAAHREVIGSMSICITYTHAVFLRFLML